MRSHVSVGKRSILIGTSVLVTFGILLGSRSVSRVQGQSRDIEQTIERFLVPFSNRDVPAFAEFLDRVEKPAEIEPRDIMLLRCSFCRLRFARAHRAG
jgi:hypothetical protein